MGQSLGKEEVEQTKELFYKQYSFIEDKQDQHYGQIKVFERNYEFENSQLQNQDEGKDTKKSAKQRLYQKARTLAIKESVYQDLDTIDKDLVNMKQLIHITEENHKEKRTKNLIDVYEYFIQTEEKFCSSVQRIQLVIEYLQRDIQIEVKTKKLQNQRFTPQEIFTIAFSCINSLYNLQLVNLAHGDLKTSNILVSEYFEIKLLHPLVNKIVPSFATMISQLNYGENFDTQGIYLSPLLTKAVSQKNYQPQHNPFKSDVFTLGVILIECCNLGTVDNLYNYETGDFNENQLKIHMNIIKNQYGIDVHDLIARMVKVQEQDRPDFIELANQLNIINQMNEVYNQQQQMIEHQASLKVAPTSDKYGVSLFKALNTEAEEYNYSQKQNSASNSFVQNNNQSMTAASSALNPNNSLNQNQITSSQQPSTNVQSPHTFAQQNSQSSQIAATSSFSFQGNPNNLENTNNPTQVKPNAFFPQYSQNQIAASTYQQNANQQQYQSQQASVSPANPKHQNLSRQQSQEFLQNQAINQPHNFGSINQTPISGVTLVKNSSQTANSNYQPTLLQYHLKPPSIPYNVQNQQSNNIPANPNFQQQQQFSSNGGTNLTQVNSSQVQPNYSGITPIQSTNQQQGYQFSNNLIGNQINLQNQPQKLQPPPTDYNFNQANYQNFTNYNLPVYDNNNAGINLQYNQISQPQANNNSQNYQIPEDVQKIINEFKEKQKINDQIYSEKEKHSQSNVKYQVIPKQESPNKIEQNSSRSVVNMSPQSNNNLSGQSNTQFNIYPDQKQFTNIQVSQQQPIQNLTYQQQEQIAQQLLGSNSQNNLIQQSTFSNPMTNTQAQAQQLIGLAPSQNQFILRSQNQQQYIQQPPQQQLIQATSQMQGNQFYPGIQQNQSFSPMSVQPQATNVFTSTDSQRNKYEHIHETYDDQSHYIGEKLGGLRHGTGKFFYADGGYYEGEWCEGRMEGLGTLYYPSGSLAYLGQWRNDQFNGKGTVYNESPAQIIGEFDYKNFDNLGEYWVKYEGDFKDDNKEGIGTIYLSNGDRFTGNFNNDFVHGQGTYFRENKNPVSGIWDCNHLVQYL
ncbi:hypothetical protein ABPG72_010591 [Tetrahymena utriculariae]